MIDEPSHNEKEYHYTEPSSVSSYQEPSGAPGMLEKMNRKGLFMMIGVIATVGIGYYLISSFFRSSAIRKPMTPTKIEAPKPIAPPAPPVAKPFPPAPAMDQERTTQLESTVMQMRSNLSNVEMQMATMDNTLQDLTRAVQQTQAQLAAMTAPKKKVASVKRKPVVKRPVYYIKAMIPGRAWLTTKSGRTLTISVGDKMPAYGTIRAIDVDQGIVVTSDGGVLHYRPDDR